MSIAPYRIRYAHLVAYAVFQKQYIINLLKIVLFDCELKFM